MRLREYHDRLEIDISRAERIVDWLDWAMLMAFLVSVVSSILFVLLQCLFGQDRSFTALIALLVTIGLFWWLVRGGSQSDDPPGKDLPVKRRLVVPRAQTALDYREPPRIRVDGVTLPANELREIVLHKQVIRYPHYGGSVTFWMTLMFRDRSVSLVPRGRRKTERLAHAIAAATRVPVNASAI